MIIERPRRQQTIRYTGQPLLVNPPHGVLASQLQSLSRADLCRLFEEGSRIFGFIRGHTEPDELIFVLYVGMVVDVREGGQIIIQHGVGTAPFILPYRELYSEAFQIFRIDGGFTQAHIDENLQALRDTCRRQLGNYPHEIIRVSPGNVPQTDVVDPITIQPRVPQVQPVIQPQVQPVIQPQVQPVIQPVQPLNLPRSLEPALLHFQSAHPSLPEEMHQAGITRGTLVHVFVNGDHQWTGTLGDFMLMLFQHLHAIPGAESDDVMLEFVALILGLRDLEEGFN
jgi:hypothetical protein